MSLLIRALLALFLVGGATWSIERAVAYQAAPGADALIALCANALVSELWLVVVVALFVSFGQRPIRARLGLARGRLRARDVATLALGTLAMSHALDSVLDVTGLADESALSEIPKVLAGARGSRLALALFALGIAPAVAEELLCRGLIQRGLTRRLGPVAGVLLAAVVFGALHLEPIHAAFATVLGIYLGVVAHWARSVRPAVVCHAANNLAAVALSVSVGDLPLGPHVSMLGGSAVACACLAAVWRRLPPAPPSEPSEPPESIPRASDPHGE